MVALVSSALTIFCWHVHVYFLQRNVDSVNAALAIHSDFLKTFEVSASTCEAEVTEGDICVWGCQDNSTSCLNMVPEGPHTFGSVGFSMPNAKYNDVIPWVFRTYEIFGSRIAGILIHPLTAPRGKDTIKSRRRDHTLGIWMPQRLPIDYDFLDHNEYDCSECDPANCTQACDQ